MVTRTLIMLCTMYGYFAMDKLNSSCTTDFNNNQSMFCPKCPDGMIRQPYKPPSNEASQCRKTCQTAEARDDIFTMCVHSRMFVLDGYWNIQVPGHQIETIPCPFGYCQCRAGLIDGYCALNESDESSLCALNRYDVLCSRCKNGYSVVFGSEVCVSNNNLQHWPFLMGLLGFIIVVLILLYFSLEEISAYANAYLFSYQIMSLFIPKHLQAKPYVPMFLIHVISMQGSGGRFQFGLFDGMDNLDKMFINYMFPLCMLLLTAFFALVIPQKVWMKVFMRHRYRITPEQSILDIRKRAFGQAVGVMLVICYTNITQITLDLFDRVEYMGEDRVYKAAEFKYLTAKKHQNYAIVAGIIGLFVVVGFPLIILIFPLLEKRFTLAHRCEYVMDALRYCFKKKHKMFAVFYFICRLLLLSVSVFVKVHVSRVLICSILCLLFLVVFGSLRPYKNNKFNFWDTLLLGNICLMTNISLVLNIKHGLEMKFKVGGKILELLLVVSIYFPLLTAVLRMFMFVYARRFFIYDKWKQRHEQFIRIPRQNNVNTTSE